MKKPKLPELELVRALAIIAVVLIHGTSEGAVDAPVGSGMQLAFLAVNKLCSFAVPLFIFVSGVVLFYGAPEEWDRASVAGFYRGRLRTVLGPYLMWTTCYYVFNQWLAHGMDMRPDPVYFAKLLVTGNASYHLYYLVVIVQLYAVFPLLSWLSGKWGAFARGLLWIGAAVQIAWYAAVRHLLPGFEFDYLCGLSYAAYFAFGGWLGLRYQERAERLRRLLPWSLAAAIGCGVAYAALFAAAQTGKAAAPPAFELLFAAFGLAAAAAIVPLAQALLARGSAAAPLLARLGAASFGVYLLHPLLLSLWREAARLQPEAWPYAAVNTIGIAAALGGSWAVTEAYRQLRRKPVRAVSANGTIAK